MIVDKKYTRRTGAAMAVSALAALCLAFRPTAVCLALEALAFCGVCLAIWKGWGGEPVRLGLGADVGGIVLTAVLEMWLYQGFYARWSGSHKAEWLAGTLHVSLRMLLVAVGFLGCAAGFYAVHRLVGGCIGTIRRLASAGRGRN